MQTPGERLRERVMAEYAHNGTEPDGREQEALDRACETADAIGQLDAVLDADGPTVLGSSGQTVLHPAIAELRQQRAQLHRFLTTLDFVGDGTAASLSAAARHSASKRWAGRGGRKAV